jgi:nucleoside-diphosphate kinase
MAAERTLVLIKPDAVRRGLAGEILRRFELRGLEIREARLLTVDRDLAESTTRSTRRSRSSASSSSSSLRGRPWRSCWRRRAIATVRTTMGATNPADAGPGTIRGDLALSMPDNLVHGSDSAESAAREISLWFD